MAKRAWLCLAPTLIFYTYISEARSIPKQETDYLTILYPPCGCRVPMGFHNATGKTIRSVFLSSALEIHLQLLLLIRSIGSVILDQTSNPYILISCVWHWPMPDASEEHAGNPNQDHKGSFFLTLPVRGWLRPWSMRALHIYKMVCVSCGFFHHLGYLTELYRVGIWLWRIKLSDTMLTDQERSGYVVAVSCWLRVIKLCCQANLYRMSLILVHADC